MVTVEDFESRYRAVASRDRRFEGRFLVAVTTTGVYCRVGCASRTPRADHVRFFPTPGAAEAAGFRAYKRCRPDREGDSDGALVTHALRLVATGFADGAGVSGLAHRLGVSPRTLDRRITAAVGASPLQLVRSRRVQTARTLIAESSMPLVDVAFAAGFGSLRQFNDAMRQELGVPPSAFRAGAVATLLDRSGEDGGAPPDAGLSLDAGPAEPPAVSRGWLSLRLARREPFASLPLLSFLATRAVPGVESGTAMTYSRALRARGGVALVALTPATGHVLLRARLDSLSDLEDVVRRCRRLLDLDSDPEAVAAGLGADPLLGDLIGQVPGLRVPGSAEPFETAVRAVLGQQVSVVAARTLAGRLAARHGDRLTSPFGEITHLFPTPQRLAEADLDGLGLTGRRVASIRALSQAVTGGGLDLDRGDPAEVEEVLSGLPGFGPWTRAYIAMRARGDPDAIPISDLGLRRAMERLGQPADTRSIARRAEAWRPWRAYAALQLWTSLAASAAAPTRPVDPGSQEMTP